MDAERFISQHLHRLLTDHNCVVIPGLGGFVCNERPARYDDSRQELIPPARDMMFNERLVHNDGVLAHVLASSTGKSYAEALNEVEREADWMRAALRDGDAVALAHVGRLFRSSPSDPVSFVADPALERLLSSFGLQRIPLRPLAPSVEQGPESEPTPVVPIERPASSTPAHPLLRRLAAVLSIPLLAGSAWLGFSDRADLMNLVPDTGWVSTEAVAFIPRFEEEGVLMPNPVETEDVNRFDSLLGGLSGSASVRYDFAAETVKGTGTHVRLRDVLHMEESEPEAPLVINEVAAQTPVPVENFWLVAGAFGIESNARNHAASAQAKGWNAEVRLGTNGLNMVILGAFEDAMIARMEMDRIRQDGEFQVWLKTL